MTTSRSKPTCWFAQFTDTPCEGQLIRAHLIPKQKIAQRFRKGAVYHEGLWLPPVEARSLPDDLVPARRTLRQLQDDPRAWRPACGGLVGLAGHHGAFDFGHFHVPRSAIPPDVKEYARELGLTWLLERRFA